MMSEHREYSSFRDPSGTVYTQDGTLFRQINPVYYDNYRHLMDSGLYDKLVKEKLLVPHQTVREDGDAIVIQPLCVPFISYPYEWCFGQYKAAALATLAIHLLAFEHGMILKDASAYNIQFINGHPLLIDTLSFEMYKPGDPWIAYGQFCRHFLAPLLLMTHLDVRLGRMTSQYIDGIPLDLASTLLGHKGGMTAAQHIRLHASATRRYAEAGKQQETQNAKLMLSTSRFIAIPKSLTIQIEKLRLKNIVTEWGDYYATTNYSPEATGHKQTLVRHMLSKAAPYTSIWDLGANDGRYSRLALEVQPDASLVAFDIDPIATERNYTTLCHAPMAMLPLVLDLTNPTPGIGFANRERATIDGRQHPDVVLMLAVIHHLAISNNLPFAMIASWLASFCHKHLILEFVPKHDSQVELLLKTRPDIFPDYDEAHFEAAFGTHFSLVEKKPIEGTQRSLYLFSASSSTAENKGNI